MALSKEQAAAARTECKPATKLVPAPVLGGDVLVRGMRFSEGVAFRREQKIEDGQLIPPMYFSAFVVRCCVDEAGERLWADSDAEWLDQFPEAVTELYRVAAQLSGLAPDSVAEKKDS